MACESSDGGSGGGATNVAQRLSDSVAFRLGQLIPEGLPEPTDDVVDLVELGPATLLTPGGTELLAFEVDDPEGRGVAATLLQFGDEDSHLRGEVEESGGSTTTVVENVLEVDADLCEGLCDGVLSIAAKLAVELQGGKISVPQALEIALDCRGRGTEGACPPPEGSNPSEPALICDDVTNGGAALTSDDQLDAYFDALRTLALYSKEADSTAQDALDEITDALGSDAESDGIPSALEARIAEATEAGLLVLIGDPGCAVRAARVSHTLRVCDHEVTAEQASMQCSGLCEPGIDRNACADAASTGCRGVTQEGACEGTCIGACQVALAEPRICQGTCIGTCEGECAGEQGGECAGPCTGTCDGECREPISGDLCDGVCTGFCEQETAASSDDPLPSCDSPLRAFCGPAEDDTLVCRGDCFGDAELSSGDPICQASALAIGDLSARCDAPIVQIYFAYNTAAEASTQQDFSTLINTVNDPVTTLLVLLDRIDLLASAASELLTAAEGPVADRIAQHLDELPAESADCAESVVDSAAPWLQDQVDLLQSRRDEILAIAAVLDTTGL